MEFLIPLREKHRVHRYYKCGHYVSRDVSNGPDRKKHYRKRAAKLGPKARAYGPPWSTAESLRKAARKGSGGEKKT